ncbi:MAG: hypothetical protein NTV34_12950 [Proteobacteria bacterium]|nr:hypothetical protein [Pseudomonadota bacterium]
MTSRNSWLDVKLSDLIVHLISVRASDGLRNRDVDLLLKRPFFNGNLLIGRKPKIRGSVDRIPAWINWLPCFNVLLCQCLAIFNDTGNKPFELITGHLRFDRQCRHLY